MAESQELQGVVAAYSSKNGGIMIDQKWYNIKNKEKQLPTEPQKGDTVSFKWKKGKNEKGFDSNNIVTVVKIEAKAKKKEWNNNKGKGNWNGNKGGWKEDPAKQESIIRQTCVKAAAGVAASILTAKTTPDKAAEMVIEIAEKLAVFCTVKSKAEEKVSPKKEDDELELEEEEELELEDSEEESFEELEDDDSPY